MQPFQGKKLKIPHRASSQQTDAALSRLQVLGCRMNQKYGYQKNKVLWTLHNNASPGLRFLKVKTGGVCAKHIPNNRPQLASTPTH